MKKALDIKKVGLEPIVLYSTGKPVVDITENPISSFKEIEKWSGIYGNPLLGILITDDIAVLHYKGNDNLYSYRHYVKTIRRMFGKTCYVSHGATHQRWDIFRVSNKNNINIRSQVFDDNGCEIYVEYMSSGYIPASGKMDDGSRITINGKHNIVSVDNNKLVHSIKLLEEPIKKRNYQVVKEKKTIDGISSISNKDATNVRLVAESLFKVFGKEEGYERLCKWLEGSDIYQSERQRLLLWASLNRNDVVALAITNEKDIDTDDQYNTFLARYVYIISENKVADLEATGEKPQTILSLKREYASSKYNIYSVRNNGIKRQNRNIVDRWLSDDNKKVAWDTIFIPKTEKLPRKDGRVYFNTFVPKSHKMVREYTNLKFFKNHIKFLIPKKKDRQWFYNWLAHLIQYPDQRPTVHVLHISRYAGTGRGWVINLIEELIGSWNCGSTEIATLQNKNLDGLKNKLFMSIHEVRHRDKVSLINDRIRTVLSEKKLPMQAGTFNVYTRFFMMSNHLVPLNINDDERRIAVFECKEKSREREYYEKLNRLLGNKVFLSNVYTFLQNIKVDHSKLYFVPLNKAKRELIARQKSATEKAFDQVAKEIGERLFTFEYIRNQVKLKMREKSRFAIPNVKEIDRLLGSLWSISGKDVTYYCFTELEISPSEAEIKCSLRV